MSMTAIKFNYSCRDLVSFKLSKTSKQASCGGYFPISESINLNLCLKIIK
jgi:hypothetical protein